MNISAQKFVIEYRPVAKLIPYVRNARTHTAQQVAQIAASIKEFGWTNPILVGNDDVIIAGHARLLAAQKLGMTEVPVIVLGHLTSAQRKALVLADNKLALNAGWDEDLLRVELEDLQTLDFDLDLIGFSPLELDDLLRDPITEERADEAPPLPEVAASQAGDLWLLGEHRVLCGDATRADAVVRLLSGRKPLLMVTDPPYGVTRQLTVDHHSRHAVYPKPRCPLDRLRILHVVNGDLAGRTCSLTYFCNRFLTAGASSGKYFDSSRFVFHVRQPCFRIISFPQQQRGFKFPPLPGAAPLVTRISHAHCGSGHW